MLYQLVQVLLKLKKKKKQKTLKALIGILFLIGLTKRSSFELYWSTGDFIQIPNLKT